MGTICLQCGDKGSPNAFVYCVKCLNFAVHRYCLDVIPETLDEFVHWVCGDDCEGEAQDQSAICNHIVSENVKGTRDRIVPEIIELFSGVGIKENDLLVGPEKSSDACTKADLVDCSLLPEDERKICQPSFPVQLEAKKDRGKKSKKRKRSIDKDEHNLDKVTSCKKDDKKRVKVACDTKLLSKVKDDEGYKQRDEKQISLRSSKKKKTKTIISSEENLLENKAPVLGIQHAEEEEGFSKVKDDEVNKQGDEKCISLRSSKKKRKKTVISSKECILENKAPALGNEHAEEEAGFACDTELPSTMEDDEGSKQRDEKQISMKSSKKKKKKKTIISSEGNILENKAPKAGCDTELPSTVKNDKGNKQRDEERISVKSSKKKKKKPVISSKENLLENKAPVLGNQRAEEKAGFPPSTLEDDEGNKQRDEERLSTKSSKKKKKKTVISSENKLVKLENQCVEKSTEENKHIPSKAYVGNGELEDREKRNSAACDKNDLCEDIPKDLHVSSAEPVAMPIWRGSFSIWNEKRGILNGLLAHVSILACEKVYDEALQFQPVLRLEMLPKSDVWPKSFETSEPRGDNIALYFFPSKSSEQDFDHLVDEMTRNELALKAIVQNAELLIFNSSELPLLYWKFQGKYYLWGVFRKKQNTPSNSHPCRMEFKDKNPIKHTDETSATPKGHNALSPRSPLSNSASCGSHT